MQRQRHETNTKTPVKTKAKAGDNDKDTAKTNTKTGDRRQLLRRNCLMYTFHEYDSVHPLQCIASTVQLLQHHVRQ